MAANLNFLFHFTRFYTQLLKPLFQVFHFEASEEFLEYISEGALSIEIWGNRSKGFGQTSWTPNIEPIQINSEDG